VLGEAGTAAQLGRGLVELHGAGHQLELGAVGGLDGHEVAVVAHLAVLGHLQGVLHGRPRAAEGGEAPAPVASGCLAMAARERLGGLVACSIALGGAKRGSSISSGTVDVAAHVGPVACRLEHDEREVAVVRRLVELDSGLFGAERPVGGAVHGRWASSDESTAMPIDHRPLPEERTSTTDGSPVRSRAKRAAAMPPARLVPEMVSP
jgi:hypothetical protein